MNSDGALRTTIHNRTPQAKNRTSTRKQKEEKEKQRKKEINSIENLLSTRVASSSSTVRDSQLNRHIEYILDVKVWSHQSVLHRNDFKWSSVRPKITTGGATNVLISNATPTKQQSIPNFLINEASVILIALADRIRNITDILRNKNGKHSIKH